MSNTAMYLRLSVDDRNISGFSYESSSISSQRALIKNYINTTELADTNIEEYVDDGITGTHFKRPAVQQMLKRVKAGKIDCIIVKDLSRFGRNCVEVGDYIEQIFPMLNVRFIAINDNYDSAKEMAQTNTSIAFKSLTNEFYSRYISANVKATKRQKLLKGEYLGGFIRFGYRYSNGKFTVHEDEAEVVRKIFDLASHKVNFTDIARLLNINAFGLLAAGNKSRWTARAVQNILSNEFYIGNLVLNKSETSAPHKAIQKDKNEWIIFEDDHAPIVSKELFFEVNKNRIPTGPAGKRKLHYEELRGKIRCGQCKSALVRHGMKVSDGKKKYYFSCQYPRNGCCTDRVFIDDVKEILLKSIDTQLKIVINNYERLSQKFQQEKLSAEQATEKLNKQIEELKNKKMLLYTDYKKGLITKESFIAQKESITEKIDAITQQIAKINENGSYDAIQKAEVFFKTYNTNKLTNEQLIEMLIKNVYIYSKDKICIEWNFADIFSE